MPLPGVAAIASLSHCEAAVLASLLIVFREVIEAGLIIGIVLAATRSVPGRAWWIAGGVAAGLADIADLTGARGRRRRNDRSPLARTGVSDPKRTSTPTVPSDSSR